MSSGTEDMKYWVLNLSGHITVEEIPTETKLEVEDLRFDMVIHDED